MIVHPRTDWGAGRNGRAQIVAGVPGSGNRGLLNPDVVTDTAVHWPGGGENLTQLRGDDVRRLLRKWQADHRAKADRWGDIGYGWLIDGAGEWWEGCGWYRGAHAGTAAGNRTAVGVQFIYGTNERPTDAQIESFREGRHELILPRFPRAEAVRPHSYYTGTACPGGPLLELTKNGSLLLPPTGDDDMALDPERDYPALSKMLWRFCRFDSRPKALGGGAENGLTIFDLLGIIRTQTAVGAAAGIDPKEIAAEVVAALPDELAADVLELLSKRIGGKP